MTKTSLIKIIAIFITLIFLQKLEGQQPVSWWKFDAINNNKLIDDISEVKDTLIGYRQLVNGVKGSSLKLDGYTTRVVRKSNGVPEFIDGLAIESWIALQALPWNWSAIVSQADFGHGEQNDHLATEDIIPLKPSEPEYEHKIFFGVDAYGHLGFKLNINGKLYECVSEEKLPLLKWSHVAATFDAHEGMKIFINGELKAEFVVQGTITPGEGSDLLLGMNIQKMGPVGSERQASAEILSNMVIYGLLDEVKIYDLPLTENHIRQSYEAESPDEIQPLAWDPMPSGPEELKPEFNAFYTRLVYTEEWEFPWRISDHSDILIHFDKLPVRFIFWRGTSYGGAWISENGLWMGDQSLERSNRGKSPMGCSEHMSDKQTRYSSVRIIEKNDARIVVQWRYAISDIIYDIFGTNKDSGWGEWADEYYYIYPDGISTRHQTLWTDYLSHEWQETIVLNQPGTSPDDNIDLDAMTLVNMNGDSKTYSWKDGPPKSFHLPENANIQLVNLKSKYKPFIVFEPYPKIKPFSGSVRPEYAHFPWWNHWPVAQLPNDGRKAFGPDRASHSSLSQAIEDSEVIHDNGDGSFEVVTLVGMSDKPAASLAKLARSWNNAPGMIIKSNEFAGEAYSKKERAFIISNKNEIHLSVLEIMLQASDNSPLVNPSFVIKNWGDADVKLTVNGKKIPRGESFRYGYRNTMEGIDLVFWIEMESSTDVYYKLTPQKNRSVR